MKHSFQSMIIISLIAISIVSCNQVLPSPTPTSTPSPTVTPEIEKVEVDLTVHYSNWSPEIQAQHPALIDPYNSTAEQRASDDAWLTNQLRLTLKNAGVENAMNLSGYDLLTAAVDWARSTGKYEIDLPFSLFEQVITDGNTNLIGYEDATGFGYGHNASPYPSRSILIRRTSNFKHVTIFYKVFTLADNPDKPFAMDIGHSVSGDAQVLIYLPGINPEAAQALLTVIGRTPAGKSNAFNLSYVVYDSGNPPKTKDTDLCEGMSGNMIVINDCSAGLVLGVTRVRLADQNGKRTNLTHKILLEMLKQNPDLHIGFNGDFMNIWVEGMINVTLILVPPMTIPTP